MKHASIIASVLLSALALLGSLNVALAQSDCKTLVKASPFGPDDQTGATNRITPAVTKAAAAEIQTGAVFPRLQSPTAWPCSKLVHQDPDQRRASFPAPNWQEIQLSCGRYLSQPKPCRYAYRRLGHIGIRCCHYNQTPMGKSPELHQNQLETKTSPRAADH